MSARSLSQRPPSHQVTRSPGHHAVCLVTLCLGVMVTFNSGCGPKYTYPSSSVPKSIEDICRKENNIEVTARVVGKTVGALVYVDQIIDSKGQIPKDVHEQMGKVMQAVSRVALSTDLALDFCSVVIRDKKHPNELVVVRSVDDTKRANSDAIGIEESINRTIFGQNKFRPDSSGENAFLLKEVKLENFLSEQIVQRIRYNLSKGSKEDKEDPEQSLALVDGIFSHDQGKRAFHFSVLSLKSKNPRQIIIDVLRTIDLVFAGYHFTDFDEIEIQDYLNRQKLVLDRKTFLDYQTKKIKEQELLAKFLTESQSIQEAFKLFGFNVPSDPASSTDKDTRPVSTATL